MKGILERCAPRPGEKCAGCGHVFGTTDDTYSRDGVRFYHDPGCEKRANRKAEGGQREL